MIRAMLRSSSKAMMMRYGIQRRANHYAVDAAVPTC